MEEYLEKLLSQIRCRKARPYISDEIRSHIEDQISDNITNGMSSEDAEKNAVADMGDPIEAGISLDKIHKPQVAWKLLVVVGVLSILGVLIQLSVFYSLSHSAVDSPVRESAYPVLTGFVSSVLEGFVVMCCIYFIDYTAIAKYSKLIGLFMIGVGVLLIAGFFGRDSSGMHYYVGFGIFRFSADSFMMFYVPIYGAILYKYREGGVTALLKSAAWLIVPVIITVMIPNVIVAAIMMTGMLIQLTAAIRKGWFRIPIKKTAAVLWSAFLVLPVVVLFSMHAFHMLKGYQEARIQAFLSAAGEENYVNSLLRTISKEITLFGNGGSDVLETLPEFNSGYIFSYILHSYGLIAGIVIAAVIAAFIVSVFAAFIKQKNELGLVMGLGCGMIFSLNTILNLLTAIGLFPPASSFLPFFSVGRSNILLSYALVGIILSIYRYKDVYPRHVKAEALTFRKKSTISL